VSRKPETQPSCDLCVPVHWLAGRCKVKLSRQVHERDRSVGLPSKQGSVEATDSNGVNKETCCHSKHIYCRHLCITTSKECLINSQIVFIYILSTAAKYFVQIFRHLSYERKKKRCLFIETSCIHIVVWVLASKSHQKGSSVLSLISQLTGVERTWPSG